MQNNFLAIVSLTATLVVAVLSLVWRARFDTRLSGKEQETAYEIGIAQAREAWSLQVMSRDVDSALSALWEATEWAEHAHGFMTVVDEQLEVAGVPEGMARERLMGMMEEVLDSYSEGSPISSGASGLF